MAPEEGLFHVTSINEREQVLPYTTAQKMTLIPNLVKMSARGTTDSAESHTARLLFFGRIDEKKGIDILFEALENVSFPYTLAIAGEGREEYVTELQTIAKRRNITSLTWAGKIGNDDKFDFLGGFDFLVLPSRNENFANVVIESLSAGLPVVVSDEVGLSDYIASSGLGWVCKPNAFSLRVNLEKAFNDTAKRAEIKSSAPANVRRDFNEEKLLETYIDMYKNAMNE